MYVPQRTGRSGHLLFLRGDTLLAQSFEPSNLKLAGDPVSIANPVGGYMPDYYGNPGSSISENGVLAYHNITGARSQLVWLDRTGNRMNAIANSDVYAHQRLSPYGNCVVFDRPDSKSEQWDLWICRHHTQLSISLNLSPSE